MNAWYLRLILALVTYMKMPNLASGGCACNMSTRLEQRIVGGQASVPHSIPWLVALFVQDKLLCGGAIINDLYILTAGHCVRGTKSPLISIIVGMHRIHPTPDGERKKISQVILHEQFLSHPMYDENDIALIKLKKPLNYTNSVYPICLPEKEMNYTNKMVKIAGWGKDEQGNLADVLQETFIRVLSDEECADTSIGTHINDRMFCGYQPNADGCQGDSGGPVSYATPEGVSELIGIVSWGIGCASPRIPGVYTKTSKFLDWIHRNTPDATYCTVNA